MTYQIYPKDAAKAINFGLIVISSSKITSNAPLMVFLPGIGGKGKGTLTELQNVYNNEVPSQLKEGIEKYGFICVVVQSDSSYSLGEAKFARQYALDHMTVDPGRKYLTGLSWGGGGTAGEPLVSLEDAKLFDAIAPIAMTWQDMGANQFKAKYITDAELPVWAFHNLRDNNAGTPPAATVAYIDAINALNPRVKATKTMFWQPFDNHGGWGEAYNADKIPIDPQSQGLINPACNLYEWMLMNNNSTRLAVPSLTTQPVPPMPSALNAVFNITDKQTITISSFELDASASTGVKADWDGYLWGVTPGTGPWSFTLQGGAYGGPKKTITGLKNGTYNITLTVKDKAGNIAQKAITIIVALDGTQPIVKKPVSFAAGKLTFDDGTSEAATAVFTTAAGKTYTA